VNVKIAVAGDHAGFHLKKAIVEDLRSQGWEVVDLGAKDVNPTDDYPDFAVLVADALRKGEAERGILICGSGVGVCIAVNKHPGMRAGLCHDTYSAAQGVEHDNMNVLCLGERVVGYELARAVIRAFLGAQFSADGRHLRRYQKVLDIEKRYSREGEAAPGRGARSS
jgi:ribose 5-phosphate isomerase B